ncbi:NACHT domain-containing protein [Sorangium sp. So ce513]|uniref:NACHT domain-containing protein n=1 Tax=Sorangium sp. So ce513 TaxID=3133315 RepID=UPI003F5F4EBC
MDGDELRRWLWADAAASAPNDPAAVLWSVERDHVDSVWREHSQTDARVLIRNEQRPMDMEVLPRRVDAPSRCTVPELLARHERVLVVGGRGSGKTALIGRLAARAAADNRQGTRTLVPFVVLVSLLDEACLNERTIARLSPIGGVVLLRRALEERRALVLVDGLDEARSGAKRLSESVEAFAEAHPGNPMVVTTRPRRTGIPGYTRVELRGFVTATLLPQPGTRVVAAHHFLARRDPGRRTSLIASAIDALLERYAGEEVPPDAILKSLDLRDRRLLFGSIAWRMHSDHLVELPVESLAELLRWRLDGARWVEGSRLVLCRADEEDEGDEEDDEDIDEEEEDDEEDMDEEEDGDGDRDPLGGPIEREAAGDAREVGELAQGELAQDIDGMVERVIEEIRGHQGLLIERRPGSFSFADLSYQAYLNALDHVRIGAQDCLIEARSDPWSHETIVHAAGIPEVDAAAYIRELLEADRGEAPVATLLAARCAEVAGGRLPPQLRRTIARRLSDLVPPRNPIHVAHLVDDVGEVAGPALIQALSAASPSERAYTAMTLGGLRHRPAYGVLVRMAADDSPVNEPIVCWLWDEEQFVIDQVVGFFALLSLFDVALAVPSVSTLFQQALERAPRGAIDCIYKLVDHQQLMRSPTTSEDEPIRDLEAVDVLLAKIRKVLDRKGGPSAWGLP